MPAPYDRPSPEAIAALNPGRALLWYDYADAWLNFPLGRVLDCGCGEGDFLRRIADRCTERWGADIDPDRVRTTGAHGDIQVRPIVPGEPLPFADGFFDTVIIMEVIEHVADERAVLAELARVLRPGGRLLLTTPHRGLLTFIDPGNFKFLVPGLHRFIHRTVLRRKAYYEQRFGSARRVERGMVADFTTDQSPWHRHYSYEQIRALAPTELQTLAWAAYSPAFRALWSLRLVLQVLTFGRLRRLPWPLNRLSAHLSRRQSRTGDQLLVMFEKAPQDADP